ncbi:DUF2818 family protein [Noviherbaspirillum galbum]|uniref:DUF2818 family protein n=1 Tax=Noviherbaspirillum galbum TaxID=2709383 RepID=A0A6B3SMB7_9BURK|nr:DUF2818 family protein [Noviherbaspirillum galbum]NEX61857.1 DUF2818 family protein [Noviherbaspirillum galbum]
MEASSSAWIVILLGIAAANLPFVNERLFGLIPVSRERKPLWMRLLELIVLYFLVGLVGYLIESRIGNVFSQTWEFYAITACLFLVLAFPGFVFRYLRRHRQ